MGSFEPDAGKFASGEIEARNNQALRRFFLEEAAATLEWLRGMGLTFQGPNQEPPNRVLCMHNVVPGAGRSGLCPSRSSRETAGASRTTASWS